MRMPKGMFHSFLSTPHWLQAIRKNGFNPIGSVKAGLFLFKIVHFTIDLIFGGISKILPEKPQ
jgi:hypothetical protein